LEQNQNISEELLPHEPAAGNETKSSEHKSPEASPVNAEVMADTSSEPQTTPDQPQTAEMEVHHAHHLTHKKKWNEYLLEFLMLFLAVFLGFLAENVREHQVEKNRLKEYMHGLVDDLKADTGILTRTREYQTNFVRRFDSLNAIAKSTDKEAAKRSLYTMAQGVIATLDFTYTDKTANQLRSTGYYRLIKNKELADSIVFYDSRMRKAQDVWQAQRLDQRSQIMELGNEIFDMEQVYVLRKKRSAKMNTDSIYNVLKPTTASDAVVNRYLNKYAQYRYHVEMQAEGQVWWINFAERLIQYIQKEYDFDEHK
jgi:hypothetical protein